MPENMATYKKECVIPHWRSVEIHSSQSALPSCAYLFAFVAKYCRDPLFTKRQKKSEYGMKPPIGLKINRMNPSVPGISDDDLLTYKRFSQRFCNFRLLFIVTVLCKWIILVVSFHIRFYCHLLIAIYDSWNFRTRELSFPETFVPWNLRSLEPSSSGTFVPQIPRVKLAWNFRSLTLIIIAPLTQAYVGIRIWLFTGWRTHLYIQDLSEVHAILWT